MDKAVEDFRNSLIEQNPDVGESPDQQLTKAINKSYEALDELTDLMMVLLDQIDCPACGKTLAARFGEARTAFNVIADIKEANDIAHEEH